MKKHFLLFICGVSIDRRSFPKRVFIFIALICFNLNLVLGQHLTSEASPVIDIGSRLELFVDTTLVEKMEGLTLTLHSPVLEDTVMTFDAPWEGNANFFVTVLKDGDLYKLYYRSTPGNVDASGRGWELLVCYAESKDGIHFTRPNLGLVEFNGNKNNNIILRSQEKSFAAADEQNFTPFIDTNPAAKSGERFKATAGQEYGLFALVSADGIHWKRKGENPIFSVAIRPEPHNLFDSQNVIFWDALRKQYVAYLRDMFPAPISGSRVRGIRYSVSKDFVNWSDPAWLDYGDETPVHQFYTNAITPYFRAPHIYFGFPMRFVANRNAKLPSKYDPMRGKGLADAVFMSSRDGIHWNRNLSGPFVSPGLDPLAWTDRSNTVALGLLPTGTDEMSVYVSRHFRLPSNHLRRGVLRLDGIVSLDAPHAGGEVVTKPFIFTGQNLVVNYSTSAAGGLRVELQDAYGKTLPGFGLKDSYELFGDSVAQVISWDAGADVSKWAGKPVRLRFLMREAKLYSFQFQP